MESHFHRACILILDRDNKLCVIMEYFPRKSLKHVLDTQTEPLSEKMVRQKFNDFHSKGLKRRTCLKLCFTIGLFLIICNVELHHLVLSILFLSFLYGLLCCSSDEPLLHSFCSSILFIFNLCFTICSSLALRRIYSTSSIVRLRSLQIS